MRETHAGNYVESHSQEIATATFWQIELFPLHHENLRSYGNLRMRKRVLEVEMRKKLAARARRGEA